MTKKIHSLICSVCRTVAISPVLLYCCFLTRFVATKCMTEHNGRDYLYSDWVRQNRSLDRDRAREKNGWDSVTIKQGMSCQTVKFCRFFVACFVALSSVLTISKSIQPDFLGYCIWCDRYICEILSIEDIQLISNCIIISMLYWSIQIIYCLMILCMSYLICM